ncbi:MAG TPA: family 16 glycoside hydrolase [Ktedonobacteraceae bacterium]|jgi:hypothetical protein|nr:family 16 glycoside hydrolase [Ktedonobacteraceae bacterium]
MRKRAALLYFVSVLIVIGLFTLLFIHTTGLPLSALFARPTAKPTAAYPVPREAPLFADNFVNDTYGWNLASSPGNYSVSVGNGALTLEIDKHQLLWEMLPGQRVFGNFTLVVNAELSSGDANNGYGIYIRGASNPQSDLATYYRFELYGDGSYAVFKGVVDASGKSSAVKVVNYTLNRAIQKQGNLNQIMIIAKGPSMSFVVNQQLLTTIIDGSYLSGSIAFFASNLPESKPGAQAQFSQLAIYP